MTLASRQEDERDMPGNYCIHFVARLHATMRACAKSSGKLLHAAVGKWRA